MPPPPAASTPAARRVWAASDAATAAALASGEGRGGGGPHPLSPSTPPPPLLSIRAAYGPAASVLLTGGTGYVGSVVLERLLRCTACPRITLLIRPKAGVAAAARVHSLLTRPLFAACHPAAAAGRVSVLEGDLTAPRLGLASTEWARLTGVGAGAGGPSPPSPPLTHIIHAAASISFTAPVHALLAQNYDATAAVLGLARACAASLVSFVHVSTAYVQAHRPRGSLVAEEPAEVGLGEVEEEGEAGGGEGGPAAAAPPHARLAARLAAASPADAEAAVRRVLASTGLPNAYCLTKHLAECLVAEEAGRSPPPRTFGLAIVRPTIVAALSGRAPHPAAVGYVGNAAGFTSVFLAYALGLVMYTCHRPHSIFDLVPGDVVASVILAAGAAAGEEGVRGGGGGDGGEGGETPRRPLIFHAASSTTNPITLIDLMLAVNTYVEVSGREREREGERTPWSARRPTPARRRRPGRPPPRRRPRRWRARREREERGREEEARV